MSNDIDSSVFCSLSWKPFNLMGKKAKVNVMHKTFNKMGPKSPTNLFTYKREMTNHKL